MRNYFLAKTSVLGVLLFFISTNSFSQKANTLPKAWHIDNKNSQIMFSVIQNNSPVTGSFKEFTGDIHAEPDKLKNSHIKIVVDMNSVSTSFAEIANTLKTAQWFDVKLFPSAVFETTALSHLSGNAYEAQGILTLRKKTFPIVLHFNLEKYTQNQAVVKGWTIIKRTDFDLARGEWAKTDSLKDEVKIEFNLNAIQ